MSIVKMKRLRLFGMAADRDALLRDLQSIGCVQVSESAQRLSDPAWSGLTQADSGGLSRSKADAALLKSALATLGHFQKEKGGLLSARPAVTEAQLFDESVRAEAMAAAETVSAQEKAIAALQAEQNKRRSQRATLAPWLDLDLPLETAGTQDASVTFGAVAAAAPLDAVREALSGGTGLAELVPAGKDRDFQYLLLLTHRSAEAEAFEALKPFGFTRVSFRGWTGTAAENDRRLTEELAQLDRELEQAQAAIAAQACHRKAMELCADRLAQDQQREDCKALLLHSDATIFLEGWVPAERLPQLEPLLAGYSAAWETADPTEEEIPEVPVKLKNNILTRSMNVITEMYSLPAYDGVDPNPLMAPFFIVFFGMMMADMGYGLLMIGASLFVLLKTKPKNGAFMEMIFWCGISTLIWGALSGGFFGDFIPQLVKMIDPASTFEMPALFTPLNDIVVIMVGSLILGAIQIVTGMTISVVRKVQAGDFLDALFDEITWWIILAGLGAFVCGMMVPGLPAFLGTLGKGMLIAGGLMLVLGGTRKAKGFGKVTALVGLIYNGVTGFFSDTLSYIRLMALMVSGSVIAQVFNTLGATFGIIPLFILISLLGNALNLALNLLGCYVHDLRLQCLEFFGRFYKEGGKPYRPLSIQTKFVDIVKEEN